MRRGGGDFREDSSPLVNIFSLATAVIYVTLLVSTAESHAGKNNANTCLVTATAHARVPAEMVPERCHA